MSFVKVKSARITEVFVSEEPIGQLAVVYISTGGRAVKEGDSTTQHLVGGVAVGGAVASGQRTPVVTHGIVSGVICGAVVSAGDRVTCANVTSGGGLASGKGKLTPINTITPGGSISQVSGLIDLVTGTISQVSGFIDLVTGTISQVSGFINLVSGTGALGDVRVDGTALSNTSGVVSGLAGFVGVAPTFTGAAPVFSGAVPVFTGAAPVFSGATPTWTGTAFNTARVLGRALDNGGIGSGIRVLVDLAG